MQHIDIVERTQQPKKNVKSVGLAKQPPREQLLDHGSSHNIAHAMPSGNSFNTSACNLYYQAFSANLLLHSHPTTSSCLAHSELADLLAQRHESSLCKT
jgi:hypothetical protein